MRHTIITLLALTFTLAACTPAPTATTTPTSTVSPTATTAPTAAPTATATQVIAPSMENLPAEWQDKVSGIETLPDGRIVALEKLSDAQIVAGLKPQLRELQWDAASNEWIPYVPKVGLVTTINEAWDENFDGWSVKSDDMTSADLQQITAEPIYGKDGQEIKPGLVADFNDATVFCGDVIEVHRWGVGRGGIMIIRVPQATGDLELFFVPYMVNYGDGVIAYAYDRDSIDTSILVDPFTYQDQPMGQVITEYPMGLTPKLGKAYQEGLADATPVRVVFAISKTAPSAGGADSPEARRKLIGSWTGEDVFNASGVKVFLDNPGMIPEAEYQP